MGGNKMEQSFEELAKEQETPEQEKPAETTNATDEKLVEKES
jgi:hypothetical protein